MTTAKRTGQRVARAAPCLLAAAGMLTGCETYRGRLYLAGSVSPVEGNAVCQAGPAGSGSGVHVLVQDLEGGELPGAHALFRQAGAREGPTRDTDRHGRAEEELRPGAWTIEVSIPGFRKGRIALELSPDQRCLATFSLQAVREASGVTR